MKKVLMATAVASVLTLTGCDKKFVAMPYNAQDAEFSKMLEASIKEDNNFAARLQLARLEFEYNKTEEANNLLETLVKENAGDMEALAWYGANKCKIVADSIPWLMGIDKYMGAKNCLKSVKTALDKAPDNFTVQLVAINTGSAVNLGDSLAWATSARQSLEKSIATKPSDYPEEVVDYFYLAAAENDLASKKVDSAKQFLQKVIDAKHNPRVVAQASAKLKSLK